jgi:hypothetical protein
MKYISKEYRRRFKELLQPLGFIRYKKAFFRVQNDMIQGVVFITHETTCNLDIILMPLASGILENTFKHGTLLSLSDFSSIPTWYLKVIDRDEEKGGLIYDKDIDDTVLDEMVELMESSLLPMFEYVNCSEMAYKAVVGKVGVGKAEFNVIKSNESILAAMYGNIDILYRNLEKKIAQSEKSFASNVEQHQQFKERFGYEASRHHSAYVEKKTAEIKTLKNMRDLFIAGKVDKNYYKLELEKNIVFSKETLAKCGWEF